MVDIINSALTLITNIVVLATAVVGLSKARPRGPKRNKRKGRRRK